MNIIEHRKFSIDSEFAPLKRVIIGLGTPYQRDKTRVASEMSEFPFVPNTARKAQVLALTYPTEAQLVQEYASYVSVLERYQVEVLFANPDSAYSFDYTCPRDIGFVVGDTFFVANMAVQSRAEEIKTVQTHLEGVLPSKIAKVPTGAVIEGGDVMVLNQNTILVGINQRTNQAGYEFLASHLGDTERVVIPVHHSQLHLDCCINPLGLGHILLHPESLAGNSDELWQVLRRYERVEVDAIEREHLVTNVLSINLTTLIARKSNSSVRVNQTLRELGYTVEEVVFDGVPATGGSFRCASLVLERG